MDEYVIKIVNETLTGLSKDFNKVDNKITDFDRALKERNKQASDYEKQWNQVLGNIGKTEKSMAQEFANERKKAFADLDKTKRISAQEEKRLAKEIADYQKQQDSDKIRVAKEVERARIATSKSQQQRESEFSRAGIAIEKQKLSTMGKDNKDYFNQKEAIRQKELGLSRNLSDSQKAILANQIRDQISMEKAKHAESISLAYKLQSTLESVFQRAVFYTAVYKGISQVTGGIKEWINSNIELDYALAKVNTISDVTVGQMAKIMDISQLTGRSAVDLTNALYEINSANIKGADAMRVMEVSTRAAVAGFTSAEDAADTLTDVLNAYKLSTSQTEAVSDKLLKAVEIGKVKWEEYHGVLGRILPSSYQLGISLDELLGSLSTLTLSGLKFNEATTGMRNIFMKMLKPTKDMDVALAGLNKDLGTSYTNIQQVLKVKGIIGTLQLLGKSMKETDLESSDLFNTVRGLTAQLSLMSDAGAKATEVTEQIKNSTGTTNQQMGVMADTIVESKNRMTAAWQALGKDVFSFGEGMKMFYAFLGGTANVLKAISPLIVGFTAAVGVASLAVAVWGAKLITTSYIIPLVSAGIQFLTTLYKKQAVEALAAGFVIERFGNATLAVGAKSAIASVGVTTFIGALSGITLILGAAAAIWAGYNAWVRKNSAETEILKERTEAMAKAFDDARKSTNLLNQVRPFAGWDVSDLTKQVTENNKVLERREELLKNINHLENSIVNSAKMNDGVENEVLVESLKQQKKELTEIEGKDQSNLKVLKSQNRELEYQKKGLTDIQVAVAEIKGGFISTEDAIQNFDLNQIGEIIKQLSSVSNFKPNSSFAKNMLSEMENKQFSTEADAPKKQLKTTEDYLNAFIALRKKKEAEGQAAIDVENDKTLSKQNSFWQKYHEAFLSQTHDGRLALIEEQRSAALLEAASMGETEERKRQLNSYYNNLILKEKKDYWDKVKSDTEKYLKEIADAEQKQADLVFAYNEKMQKQSEDLRKKDFDNRNKALSELSNLRRQYLLNDIQREQENYDIKQSLLINSKAFEIASEADKNNILLAMDKEHNEKLTELRIAEWQKQHEFYSWIVDSMESVTKTSIETVLDSEKNAQEKREAIWNSIKDLAISSFAEMVAGWIKSQILKQVVEKSMATATIATNAILTKSYLSLAAAMSMASWGASAITGSTAYIASLAAVTGANLANPVSDAIIQDNVITPFRKDDVVAIGTNMYGSRSGYGMGGIEAKIDETNKMLSVLNLNLVKKNLSVNVQGIGAVDISRLNREGEKIERRS